MQGVVGEKKSISEFYDPFSCNVLLISNHSLKLLFIFLLKTAGEYKLSNIKRNPWFDSPKYDSYFRSKTLPHYCWYFICPELWTTFMKIKKESSWETLIFLRGIQSHCFPISTSYACRGTLLNNNWQSLWLSRPSNFNCSSSSDVFISTNWICQSDILHCFQSNTLFKFWKLW